MVSQIVSRLVVGAVVAGLAWFCPFAAGAEIHLRPAYGETTLLGPGAARGAVIWSHGRSIEAEDSEAPTPLYMKTLSRAGWDVFRLDRLRVSDTLSNSSRALADYADSLKTTGYRRVALAGQSFGAFIALLAAGRSDSVDAVIGTAPAAFGSFTEAYDSFRENATRLYPILENVRRARVMLFFFHGDDFDPGGRAEMARSVLARRGIAHLVIDQPAALAGHGAANSGLFVRRFGACIERFAGTPVLAADPPCDAAWGRSPSADLLVAGLPAAASAGSGSSPASPFVGTWYGAYTNGREVVLSVAAADGVGRVSAEYVLGPGVEAGQTTERVGRVGRIDDGELVFDEAGRNVLRYRLRHDGRLSGTWIERSGSVRLDTVLRRVD